ncbi:MAG TPA: DUF5916 domain-containing protein [Bacteroidales bacterium]|nr:DUF5916 domain-containing protein [Bacteroidales bacterium]HRZ49042.1 DUF5916 domain-containing protein [Bacteroidales bacterium]
MIPAQVSGQDTPGKIAMAVKIPAGSEIRIDGLIDESVWFTATPATGFTGHEPWFGRQPRQETEAYFLYSDYGLYAGLKMLDDAPDSIYRDLTVRDDEGNTDWISLLISPENDGQNGYLFEVTAAGVQIDSRIIKDGEADDLSWDAVWYCKVATTDSGWSAEFLIPWSALRFPNDAEQSWDLNIMREVRRSREQSTWSPVDRKKHGFLTQSGKLKGLSQLHTPVRLALMPYGSVYLQKYTNTHEPSYTFNAGMDLKYGLWNNYTLDITLVPDFGQVKSDDEIYNFSPFEVKYNENRPFFTEGTELFSKSGIFYSRRIGMRPAGYYQVYNHLGPGDSLVENPQETQLINATKFSGRGSKGFAFGIFNAMTREAGALILDSSGNESFILTQPFTNYNMVVLDQSLPQNSYVHLANTNLSRTGYGANVTATYFQLKNRKQRYALTGEGAWSRLVPAGRTPVEGYRYGLGLSRISGNIRWNIDHSVISGAYNPNDMGYLTNTNVATVSGSMGYYQFQPYRNMLNYNLVLSGALNMLHQDYRFTYLQINLRGNTTYRNQLSWGGSTEVVPTDMHNYYESRVPGRVVIQPGYFSVMGWMSPDYRKKFLVDVNAAVWRNFDTIQKGYSLSLSPRLRLSNRSLLIGSIELNSELPAIGFTDQVTYNDSSLILFGARNIHTITTTLTSNYVVNPMSSFSLRIRHYWVTTRYLRLYALSEEGIPVPTQFTGNYNFTLNFFNIDLGYAWNFAPGSYLNIVYKQALYSKEDNKVEHHYIRNWNSMLDAPANNSISLKLIYYIDYETIRRNLKKETT